MRKKLSAIGNSLGIVIEKPILELLDIDRETELDMRTDGERLIIEPVRSGKGAKVRAAAQRASMSAAEYASCRAASFQRQADPVHLGFPARVLLRDVAAELLGRAH